VPLAVVFRDTASVNREAGRRNVLLAAAFREWLDWGEKLTRQLAVRNFGYPNLRS